MTSDEQIIELLNDARSLIAQGWCQHANRIEEPDGHKCYCAIGALLELKRDQSYFYATDALSRVIAHERWFESGSITLWNDQDDRTQEDVLAAYDRAIVTVANRSREFPSELV